MCGFIDFWKKLYSQREKTIFSFLKVNKSTHLQNQKTIIVYYWPFVYFSLRYSLREKKDQFFLKVNKSTYLQNQKTIIVYYWPFVYFSSIFVHGIGYLDIFPFISQSQILSVSTKSLVTLTLKTICHCDVKHIMMLLIKKMTSVWKIVIMVQIIWMSHKSRRTCFKNEKKLRIPSHVF
jgi:hypothetical protein